LETLEKPGIGRPPGRPKDDSKRSAIIDAARRIFVEHGPSGATIDAIADAAGVSRVTIYSHFENKECLMATVLHEETREFGSLSSALDGGVLSREDVRAALVAFGCSLLDFIEQPHVIRSGRMMIGHAHSMPDETKVFFENGPLRMHRRLGRLIASAKAAGALNTDDPEEDADFLIGMWRGLHHIELQFNAGPPRSEKRRHARVRRAVDLYLAARA
jgi:TetR/AcrR family transcriptional repressor of mexJK operon